MAPRAEHTVQRTMGLFRSKDSTSKFPSREDLLIGDDSSAQPLSHYEGMIAIENGQKAKAKLAQAGRRAVEPNGPRSRPCC
jgi:hypothetical protein